MRKTLATLAAVVGSLALPTAAAAHYPGYDAVKYPAKAWLDYRCNTAYDFGRSSSCHWNGIVSRPTVDYHARNVRISFDVQGTWVRNKCFTTLRINHDYVVKSATAYQCSVPA